MLLDDPNPIYDPGAPISTGGVENAAILCDYLGIKLKLDEPQTKYMHGWGLECHGARLTIAEWNLTLFDNNGLPTSFTFHLVKGNSPLIVGLDVAQFADQINTGGNPYVRIKRTSDNAFRMFNTYIRKDETHSLVERMHVEFAPRIRTSVSMLMSTSLEMRSSRSPRVFAKRIHRYTHASAEQTIDICKQAGISTPDLDAEIRKVCDACDICASSGRPQSSKKISLSHINERFNEEIQMDFSYTIIRGERRTLFIITDTGTGYTEGAIVNSRNLDNVSSMIEHMWIFNHGTPRAVSADDEFNRAKLTRFLSSRSIEFKPRPARRHNKVGIVERKHQVVKTIARKLDKDNSKCDADTILKRAVFLSNLFSGSRILCSFQLARGYQPSILGTPSVAVSQELLDAHKEQVATRALQRILQSRAPDAIPAQMFNPGDDVWVWYETTKANEAKEWIRAEVIKPYEHFLEARRKGAPCGPSMRPAYEDVRIAPKSKLTQELMAQPLEEYLEHSMEAGEEENESELPSNAQSLMSTVAIKHLSSENDIGIPEDEIKGPTKQGTTLTSDRQKVLSDIHAQLGTQQVSRRKLDFAPAWVIDEAFKTEYDSNWADAYEEVREDSVPRDANVISSHVVYKIKVDEQGSKKLKARLVPHGNKDKNKDSVRKDSATAQLGIIRLMISLVTFLNFAISTADIAGAYLQSGSIKRTIYVRPPVEWYYANPDKRGVLWKLIKLPYGIVEAGRQWMLTVEAWMLGEVKMQRVFGICQLFVKRDENQRIMLLVAKVSDDFLIGGLKQDITKFLGMMKARFEVGKVGDGKKLMFNGMNINISDCGDIQLDMQQYWDRIREIPISQARRKQTEDLATEQEVKLYRALCGTLLYLGNGILPTASLVVSLMQQRLPRVLVRHLWDANQMIKELRSLQSIIMYRKVEFPNDVTLCSFSDASHPKDRDFGQTGQFIGILARNGHKDGDVFHILDWASQKQRRVSHSAYGAEILAATYADDNGFYYKSAINSIFPRTPVRHELNVDSKGLFDTITTLHEGKEYRLRQTVQRLRNSFESKDLNVLRWIPGPINYADALTKRCIEQFKNINRVCLTGFLDIDFHLGMELHAEKWT